MNKRYIKKKQRQIIKLFLLITICISEYAYSSTNIDSNNQNNQSNEKYVIPENPAVYLDVVLNGVACGIFPFDQKQDQLLVTEDVLTKIGLVIGIDRKKSINILKISSVEAVYNESIQTLTLKTDMENTRLPVNVLTNRHIETSPASGGFGGIINYELYAGHVQNGENYGNLFNELRFFSNASVLSNTSISNFDASSDQGNKTVRLDSKFAYSWQDRLLTLRLGDGVTNSISWTRSIRYGGIHLGKDFELNPNIAKSPLTEFIGSTMVPSSVDLFINGVRQFNADVPPGPFRVNVAPGINGYGMARLVQKDALGQSQEVEIPIFAAPNMLKANLWDWGIDLGQAREDYGLKSFNYDNNLLSSSFSRYGLNDDLTIENQLETAPNLIKTGVGFIMKPFSILGVLSGYYAYSYQGNTNGNQWGLGYNWNNQRFTLGAFTSQSSDGYHDLASLYDGNVLRKSNRAFLGFDANRFGNFSFGYINQRDKSDSNTEIVNATWGLSLYKDVNLSVIGSRELSTSQNQSIYINLSASLDNRINLSASIKPSKTGTELAFNASQGMASDGGLSWALSANHSNDSFINSELNYQGKYGLIGLRADSNNNLFTSLSGSVLLMEGHIFLSRELSDAFALVSTDGLPNIPILLENKIFGKTDSSGLLVVAPLYAYQKNKISFDSLAIPFNYQLGTTDAFPVPPNKAGIFVPFSIQPSHAALFKIVDQNGVVLPTGSEVFVMGQQGSYVIGFDGAVYIEGLRNTQTLEVYLPKEPGMYDAQVCYATVNYKNNADKNMILPEIVCVPKK
ncbi:MAG: fimbria/pilus outer membrane usher protein [Neisseriaceae bacterium]|nr:fimbria/pilus outer membrane usher protein [Neisseriaceae bacterium]